MNQNGNSGFVNCAGGGGGGGDWSIPYLAVGYHHDGIGGGVIVGVGVNGPIIRDHVV